MITIQGDSQVNIFLTLLFTQYFQKYFLINFLDLTR